MLTVDAAKTIASAIVGARLDYCNRLLQGTSDYNFDRLQRIQNRLAHVVLPFSAGANEARHELHWLLIRQRITFKLATMTYKAGRSGQPAYLSDSIHDYQPARNLPSASALLLQQPPCSLLVPFRSRHPVCGILCTYTLAQLKLLLTFKSRLKTSWPVTTPDISAPSHHGAPDSLAIDIRT